jgi:hypothetical protein
MDPGSLAILMQHLAPVLGALAFFAAPVGIIWILKHHKFRMRELELEAQHGISRSAEARLSAIEARLANIEQALGAPARNTLKERAATLEGPGSSADETRPDRPRLRGRE